MEAGLGLGKAPHAACEEALEVWEYPSSSSFVTITLSSRIRTTLGLSHCFQQALGEGGGDRNGNAVAQQQGFSLIPVFTW